MLDRGGYAAAITGSLASGMRVARQPSCPLAANCQSLLLNVLLKSDANVWSELLQMGVKVSATTQLSVFLE